MECDMPCVKVCEESIIHITEDHTPYLNFDNSGCTFCTNCAKVCEKGVLNQHLEAKINSIALINKELCIAWNMTLCSSCTDVCYPKSITFSRMLNPQIDQNTCNGCGLCKNICPLSAITIEYKK
ncbi:MAG: 4Fe-4S binding protein [Spirochaetota bacterium]|nr:4Fe-4S binding protein [Spirochaetota bacterium]